METSDKKEQGVVPIFTYLHNDHPRKLMGTQIDPAHVRVTLPDGAKHIIPYDERDRRVLIIFDGDIPCDGLPRAGDEVVLLRCREERVKADCVRKRKSFELPHPHLDDGDGYSSVILRRRAILLPAGNALIMRYRPDSLAGWYCLVAVSQDYKGPNVIFRNSGY